ncbi:hypothetical protein MNBD_BACTEROID07-1981 [hydrothermal vent metagenome]|uniref:Uncharacterized protein n=1 Tax=hydrothermal vent metagenome TaxID=652676 RepID=A0A3B0V2J6_9ZZZZ
MRELKYETFVRIKNTPSQQGAPILYSATLKEGVGNHFYFDDRKAGGKVVSFLRRHQYVEKYWYIVL